LLQLEQGAQSVSQTAMIDNQPYLRLLLPMYMEQSCLRCHADTGVQPGDIRGGISTAVPLQRHQQVAAEEIKSLRLAHGGIWLFGCMLLISGNSLYRRQKSTIKITEGALASSQVRFAALTQASPTGVFQTDPAGTVIFVNDQWCVMTGLTPEQAADSGWNQILHPDDRDHIPDLWLQSVKEQRPFRSENRFIQAINILMDNAIKFTDQGTIHLSLRPLHQSGSQATLSVCVADSGIGIAPEQHEQNFMPFKQEADMSHTRKFGGSGLGLSICRRLALAMGGTVRIESAVGKGSTFYLELPFEIYIADVPSVPEASQAAGQAAYAHSNQTTGSSPKCKPDSK